MPKGGGISILAILILSVMAAGSGALFGFLAPDMMKPTAPKPPGQAEGADGIASAVTSDLKTIGPITTNLGKPSSTWIRIEAAIVMDKPLTPDAELIAKKMVEDIVGFLRTVSVEQIEGPSGFQHLREDLNDRVRIRSEGKASELIITSVIIE